MARGRPRIGKVLFTKEQIERRLDELAAEIQSRYAKCELTVVAVLKGSLFFTADLARRLDMPLRMDIMEVSSYFDGTEPSGETALKSYLAEDVRGRHVLVIDDIVDTGATLGAVLELLRRERPKSLATCVFLNKKRRRRVDVPIDFYGFELKSNRFVVGYGLDYARRYRNLPYLAALEREEKPKKKASRRKKTVTRKKKASRRKKTATRKKKATKRKKTTTKKPKRSRAGGRTS